MQEKKQKLIKVIKDVIKKDPVVLAMFEEFKVPIEALDHVSIDFKDMDVSAKTKDKKIYINSKFLEDGEIASEIHYFIHELCHYLQQLNKEVRNYKNIDSKSYLDKPTEIEAFQYQVQFMKNQYGNKRAKKYIDDLLEFHDLNGKEAEEKKRKLLGD